MIRGLTAPMGSGYIREVNIPLANLEDDRWAEPLPFLAEQVHRLPPGRALDLAMGLGRNAVYLARHGWMVDGVDASLRAVQKARAWAGRVGVRLNGIAADLSAYEIRPESYDLICCFYFLERRLFDRIRQGLRPGGAVLYQSVTTDQLGIAPGFPRDHCLYPNELLTAFEGFRVLYYREATVRTLDRDAAVASLLAIRGE